MAFNTKALKTDVSNVKPISQVYDPAIDDYDPLTGASLGSGRYGMDSIQWGKTSGGVYVPVQVDGNGVVQTALTGSSIPNMVKLISLVSSGSIAAGQSFEFQSLDVSLYDQITAMISVDAVHSWEALWEEEPALNAGDYSYQVLFSSGSQGSGLSNRISLRMLDGRVKVVNQDTTNAHNYTLTLVGFLRN